MVNTKSRIAQMFLERDSFGQGFQMNLDKQEKELASFTGACCSILMILAVSGYAFMKA